MLIQERIRAAQAEQLLKSAITQLLATGLTPEQVAALSLSVEDINTLLP